MNKIQRVREVYAKVPPLACKGLCQASCTGPIPATKIEHDFVARAGASLPVLVEPCANLVDDRCAVYETRPLICRLWGVVENMVCPHGCEPEGGHLSRQGGGQLVLEVVEIAGEAV